MSTSTSKGSLEKCGEYPTVQGVLGGEADRRAFAGSGLYLVAPYEASVKDPGCARVMADLCRYLVAA